MAVSIRVTRIPTIFPVLSFMMLIILRIALPIGLPVLLDPHSRARASILKLESNEPQQKAKGRVEHAAAERDADGVVDEGEKKILTNVSHCGTA